MPSKVPTTKQEQQSKGHNSPSFKNTSSLGLVGLKQTKEEPRAHSPYAGQGAIVEKLTSALTNFGQVAIITEHNLEGVLASTGIGYLAHAQPNTIRLVSRSTCQAALGEALIEGPVSTDNNTVDLAMRVYRGFERAVQVGCEQLGTHTHCPSSCTGTCMRHLVYACASDDPNMPEIVHRYLRLGFKYGNQIRTMLADPVVAAANSLARYVVNECEHTRQFVRFSHMQDGSFFAVFRPRANTLPLTSNYFAARLGCERFCLADPMHGIAVFHDPNCPPNVIQLDGKLMRELVRRQDMHPDEERVRAMWKTFYKSISLQNRGKEQRGYDLRTSWMPKRFWSGLPEFDE